MGHMIFDVIAGTALGLVTLGGVVLALLHRPGKPAELFCEEARGKVNRQTSPPA